MGDLDFRYIWEGKIYYGGGYHPWEIKSDPERLRKVFVEIVISPSSDDTESDIFKKFENIKKVLEDNELNVTYIRLED